MSRFYLEMMLSGQEDLMQNFQFQTASLQAFSDFTPAHQSLYERLLVVLRDTQKAAYVKGLQLSEKLDMPFSIKGNSELHQLIRILLDLTDTCIA